VAALASIARQTTSTAAPAIRRDPAEPRAPIGVAVSTPACPLVRQMQIVQRATAAGQGGYFASCRFAIRRPRGSTASSKTPDPLLRSSMESVATEAVCGTLQTTRATVEGVEWPARPARFAASDNAWRKLVARRMSACSDRVGRRVPAALGNVSTLCLTTTIVANADMLVRQVRAVMDSGAVLITVELACRASETQIAPTGESVRAVVVCRPRVTMRGAWPAQWMTPVLSGLAVAVVVPPSLL
jgi:hypothetical protein